LKPFPYFIHHFSPIPLLAAEKAALELLLVMLVAVAAIMLFAKVAAAVFLVALFVFIV
jgi:hypothetical protein